MASQIFFGAVGAISVLYGPTLISNLSIHRFKFTAIGILLAGVCGFGAAGFFAASFTKGEKKSFLRNSDFYHWWLMFSFIFGIFSVPLGLIVDGAVAIM